MSDVKVTVSFTASPYYAMLLLAAYDILMYSMPSHDKPDVSPMTLENYDTLMGELLDQSMSLAKDADGYAEDVAESIRKYAKLWEAR